MNISDDLLLMFYALVFYVILVIIICIKDKMNIFEGLSEFFTELIRSILDFLKIAIPLAIILWAWAEKWFD